MALRRLRTHRLAVAHCELLQIQYFAFVIGTVDAENSQTVFFFRSVLDADSGLHCNE